MIRLAYVSADPGVPVFGRKGNSVHVQEVVRALRGLEIDVELFARRIDGDAPPGLEDVPVHRLPKLPSAKDPSRERRALESNGEIRAMLEQAGPFDVIYERYALFSFAGMEYAQASGVPGLLEVNAPLIEEAARYRGLDRIAAAREASERAFSAATRLVAVSEEVASWLRTQVDPPDRTVVVPNGVAPGRFPEGLRPAIPHEPGTFTVGFVGSLRPWHGLSVLADAFLRLRALDPASRLLVVGDGPAREELVTALSNGGALEGARLTGAVSPEEIPALLASMDVAVAPYPALSGFYFSPLKIYEYLAAGLPVVASRIGQITAIVQDGINGLLCAPGDAAGFAGALDRLRRDRDLCGKLGRGARASIGEEQTWDGVARRLLGLAGFESGPARALDAAEGRI